MEYSNLPPSFWPHARSQVLLDPTVANLNTGSWGPLPRPVFERVTQLRQRLAEEPMDFFLRRLPFYRQDYPSGPQQSAGPPRQAVQRGDGPGRDHVGLDGSCQFLCPRAGHRHRARGRYSHRFSDRHGRGDGDSDSHNRCILPMGPPR